MAKTNWLGTYNNPTEDCLTDVAAWLQGLHERSGAVYTNGQLEEGENKTVHV